MLCYVVTIVIFVMLSKYVECVITVSSMHKFSYSYTSLFFLKIWQPNIPPSTKPRLSYTAQYQLSVSLIFYPEIHRAWDFPSGSLHYAILEVSKLTVSQNCTKVFPKTNLVCASYKITHHASLWSARKPELNCDPGLHYSPKLCRSFPTAYPALLIETTQTCEIGLCYLSLHYPEKLCRSDWQAPRWLALLSLLILYSFYWHSPCCFTLNSSWKLHSHVENALVASPRLSSKLRSYDQQLPTTWSNHSLENYIEVTTSASYYPSCIPWRNYIDS